MPIAIARRVSFRPTAAELQQMRKDIKEKSSPAYLQKVINGLELKLKNVNQPGVSPARAKDLQKQYREQLSIYKNKLALAEKKLQIAHKRKAVWVAPVPPKPADKKNPDTAAKDATSYTPSGKTGTATASLALYNARGRDTRN